MIHRLRAAGAAISLILLLAGIPALLAATVGNPAGGWRDLLAGDVSDTALIGVLATVGYLAWAQFVLATVIEVALAIARKPIGHRIPGVFSAQQHLAHALVAALLVAPGAAPLVVPAGPAPIAATVCAPQTTAAACRPLARNAPATVTYVVRDDGPGTYWDMAEAYLGSGEQWREIWHLNRGRQQGDGTVLSSPGLVRPGWNILIPTSTATSKPPDGPTVTVHSGDTLSDIATDHDVSGWPTLWRLNRGRAEPGGDRFTDPNHIEPGLGHRTSPPGAQRRRLNHNAGTGNPGPPGGTGANQSSGQRADHDRRRNRDRAGHHPVAYTLGRGQRVTDRLID
jgi:hypothetical protein